MLNDLDRTASSRAARSLTAVAALVLTALAPMTAANAVPPAQPVSLSVQQPDGVHRRPVVGARRRRRPLRRAGGRQPGVRQPRGVREHGEQHATCPTMNLRPGDQYWRVQALHRPRRGLGLGRRPRSPRPRSRCPCWSAPPTAPPSRSPTTRRCCAGTRRPARSSYIVEVDDDSDFVGSMTVETQSTSLVWPDPLTGGDWFWRVVATKENPANSGSSFRSQPSDGPLVRHHADRAPPCGRRRPSNARLRAPGRRPGLGAGARRHVVRARGGDQHGLHRTAPASSRRTRHPRHALLADRSPTTTTSTTGGCAPYDTANQPTPWSAARYDFNRTWPAPARGSSTRREPGHRGRPATRSTSSGPRSRTPRSTSSRSARRRTSASAPTTRCRTAGTTYTPGMFAINTTGQPSPVPGERGLRAGDRRDQLLAGAPARPPVQQAGRDVPGVQGIFSETQAFRYLPDVITDMTPTLGADGRRTHAEVGRRASAPTPTR